jgi:hypothetical protein
MKNAERSSKIGPCQWLRSGLPVPLANQLPNHAGHCATDITPPQLA